MAIHGRGTLVAPTTTSLAPTTVTDRSVACVGTLSSIALLPLTLHLIVHVVVRGGASAAYNLNDHKISDAGNVDKVHKDVNLDRLRAEADPP